MLSNAEALTFRIRFINIDLLPPEMREVFLLRYNKHMDAKLKREKLKMWNENLQKLEAQLIEVQHKKGAAAQEGDLSENAAYTMAIEDAVTLRVQIEQVKKIIAELESNK